MWKVSSYLLCFYSSYIIYLHIFFGRCSPEEEADSQPALLRRTTIGNGLNEFTVALLLEFTLFSGISC